MLDDESEPIRERDDQQELAVPVGSCREVELGLSGQDVGHHQRVLDGGTSIENTSPHNGGAGHEETETNRPMRPLLGWRQRQRQSKRSGSRRESLDIVSDASGGQS
jgi:hypothetical protein